MKERMKVFTIQFSVTHTVEPSLLSVDEGRGRDDTGGGGGQVKLSQGVLGVPPHYPPHCPPRGAGGPHCLRGERALASLSQARALIPL